METKFDMWCIVELFGHSKIAGKCTEQTIAGANMLRVDVPETLSQPSFTRFFNSSAIYSIIPADESTVKFMADKLEVKPIEAWNISEVVKKFNQQVLLKETTEHTSEEDEDDFDSSGF